MRTTEEGTLHLIWRKARSKGLQAMLLAVLLATPLGASVAMPTEDLVVRDGETVIVSDSLHVRSLTVLGTLEMAAPGDWIIQARDVRVGSGGLIQGLDGANGADARGADA